MNEHLFYNFTNTLRIEKFCIVTYNKNYSKEYIYISVHL